MKALTLSALAGGMILRGSAFAAAYDERREKAARGFAMSGARRASGRPSSTCAGLNFSRWSVP